jgi:hypothetical protein
VSNSQPPAVPDYPPPGLRALITLFTLAAAFMTQLDATIANVALPHMQARPRPRASRSAGC